MGLRVTQFGDGGCCVLVMDSGLVHAMQILYHCHKSPAHAVCVRNHFLTAGGMITPAFY